MAGKSSKARRRQKKKRPAGEASAGRAGGTQAAGSGGAAGGARRARRRRDNELKRLASAAAAGDDAQVEQLLDRLWPRTGRVSGPRLRWLAANRPAWLVAEIEKLDAAGREHQAVGEALGAAVLGLDAASCERLGRIESRFATEALVVRTAAEHIAAGRDEAGLRALRPIGLRSPLRPARLALRGLSAWYRRRDAEAARAFAPLAGDRVFGPLAEAVLYAIEPDPGVEPGPATARCLRALGAGHALEAAAYAAVGRELAGGRPNRALRVARRVAGDGSAGLRRALRRDLAGALSALGVEPYQILERIERSLGGGADDPELSGLGALVYELDGDRDEALGFWLDYSHELADLPPEIRAGRAVLAAVHARIGQRLAAMAEEPSGSLLSLLFGHDVAGQQRQDARHHLEKALELDPEDLHTWRALLDLLERQGVKAERARVLERFAARFPDHPEALLAAAAGAEQRGALDKALRHIRRAAAVEPLNRRTRARQARLLCAKARKQMRAGRMERARKCYRQAAGVSGCPAKARIEAQAEAAAFEDLSRREEQAAALKDEALQADPRPWLWAGHFLAARRRLHGRRRGRLPGRLDPLPPEPPPPQPEELLGLLELPAAYGDAAADRPPGLEALVERALAAGSERLLEPAQLDRALALCPAGEPALALAEQAQRLHPGRPAFVAARYQRALDCGRPAAYFTRALEELQQARAAQQQAGAEPGELVQELERLDRRVRALLKRGQGGTARRTRRPGKRRGAGQGKLPF